MINTSFSYDTLAAQAKAVGRFIAEGADRPEPGDIFLIRRTPTDWKHGGIVVEIRPDSFTTIEGNSKNSVTERLRSFRDTDFISMADPADHPED
jgi:hypothetical protein